MKYTDFRIKGEIVNEKINKKVTFVVYDGIENSVFQSQVLHQLLNLLEKEKNTEVNLVSFERNQLDSKYLIKSIPAHDRLHLVICKRLPFFGKISLLPAIYMFKKIMEVIPSDKIIARGPLAGFVAKKAISLYEEKCFCSPIEEDRNREMPTLKIQARGLCAEEYRYINKLSKKNILTRFIRSLIYQSLRRVEHDAYCHNTSVSASINFKVEAVSPALKDYLIDHFCSNPARTTITRNNSEKEEPSLIAKWKSSVRNELSIPKDYTVYCYSGSFKPWQCISEMMMYFDQKLQENAKSFLLVLTPDIKLFEKELAKLNIPKKHLAILSVPPSKLNRYLSTANFGLLFRKRDIINWVARPTKAIEYQSVGLPIIHNNTVSWLENN
jgi:hypothetical protein